MDCLLLRDRHFQCIQFLVKASAHRHSGPAIDLLPQVSSEYLDERDLQCGDLAVHEDSCQVQLHLEAHIDIGSIDGWGPPEGKSTIRNLV